MNKTLVSSARVVRETDATQAANRIRAFLLELDRWLGRRGVAFAVLILTGFATLLSGALSLALYWLLFGAPPRGMAVINPIVSISVAAPIIWYAQLIIRNLAQTKRQLGVLTEQLSTAYDLADGANRAKSTFLANMSHELRTPLNAIIGFSEVLKDAVLGPHSVSQYAEYAQDIHNSGNHLLNIINDILDLSKIEAGKFDMKEEEIDLLLVVQDVSRMVTPLAAKQQVSLTFPDARALPHLMGSPRLVQQVLINLLSNGIKFTRPGGAITLTIDHWAGEDLVVEVIDTGIGMSEADIARAMMPFGQVDASLSRQYEGTGLGLPLTKAMVEQHGGALTIASAPGKGTRASVRFPKERIVVLAGFD